MKNKILHPAFFIVLLILILMGQIVNSIIYFLAVVVHEISHAKVANRLGYKLTSFYLMPYGVCLSYKNAGFSPEDEIKIAVVGPLASLGLCVFLCSLWWIFPITYAFTLTLFISSFSIFLFNLLPIFPLDGGRILFSYLTLKFNEKVAQKILKIINIVFILLFFTIFIISIFYEINFNYLFITILFCFGFVDNIFTSKYEKINYHNIAKKRIHKGEQVNFIIFDENTTLSNISKKFNRKKYNFIYIYSKNKLKIISETKFYEYLSIYGSKATFHNIF